MGQQSRQLNNLARALVKLDGSTKGFGVIPKHLNAEGVKPALLEGGDLANHVQWLKNRILEIRHKSKANGKQGPMPSTVIFVNTSEEVEPIANKLGKELNKHRKKEHRLEVFPCSGGVWGDTDAAIRVIEIHHIKGSEFESAFFIGVDQLANAQPDLFDKFLYVGATRAATYLGLTCFSKLPKRIGSLRRRFVYDWQ